MPGAGQPRATRRLRAVHSALAPASPHRAAAAVEPAPFNSRRSPLVAMHGVASSSQPLVSEIGMRIMRALIPSGLSTHPSRRSDPHSTPPHPTLTC